MLNFIVMVRGMVQEKEMRLKEGMRMMGLKELPYWTSWYLTCSILFILFFILFVFFIFYFYSAHINLSLIAFKMFTSSGHPCS